LNPLYTIGYQGLRSVYTLLSLAVPLDATLIDIRMSPWSRRAEWRQDALLKELCDLQFGGLKCRYVHIQELGNVNYRGDGPIEIWLPEIGLDRLDMQLRAKPCILLCQCPDFRTCHRGVVADLAVSRLGVEVEHLTVTAGGFAARADGSFLPGHLPTRPVGVAQVQTRKVDTPAKPTHRAEAPEPTGQMSLW